MICTIISCVAISLISIKPPVYLWFSIFVTELEKLEALSPVNLGKLSSSTAIHFHWLCQLAESEIYSVVITHRRFIFHFLRQNLQIHGQSSWVSLLLLVLNISIANRMPEVFACIHKNLRKNKVLHASQRLWNKDSEFVLVLTRLRKN